MSMTISIGTRRSETSVPFYNVRSVDVGLYELALCEMA